MAKVYFKEAIKTFEIATKKSLKEIKKYAKENDPWEAHARGELRGFRDSTECMKKASEENLSLDECITGLQKMGDDTQKLVEQLLGKGTVWPMYYQYYGGLAKLAKPIDANIFLAALKKENPDEARNFELFMKNQWAYYSGLASAYIESANYLKRTFKKK